MLVTLHGRPVPKARPRPGKSGRFYVPSQAEQEAFAMVLRRHHGKFVRSDQLSVRIEFHFVGGARPGDIDNLQKLVLDALQDAGVIPNDLQIVELYARIIRPSVADKTVVSVERLVG